MKYNELKSYAEGLEYELGVLDSKLSSENNNATRSHKVITLAQDILSFNSSEVPNTPRYIDALMFLLKNKDELKRKLSYQELRVFADKYLYAKKMGINTMSDFKKVRIICLGGRIPLA